MVSWPKDVGLSPYGRTLDSVGDATVKPPERDLLHATFEAYYEAYRQPVYGRIRRRLARYRGPASQAVEDLFQNVFVNAFRWMTHVYNDSHQVPSREHFEKALKKIEATKYADYWRRSLKQGRHETGLDDLNGPAGPGSESGVPLDPPALRPGPYEELRVRELKTRLESCLERLRSQESSAILFKVQGHSDSEVSALIGEDVKKVTHSIIPLARKKLRKCMEAHL